MGPQHAGAPACPRPAWARGGRKRGGGPHGAGKAKRTPPPTSVSPLQLRAGKRGAVLPGTRHKDRPLSHLGSLYNFPGTCVAKSHRPDGLKTQKCVLLPCWEARHAKMQRSAGPCSVCRPQGHQLPFLLRPLPHLTLLPVHPHTSFPLNPSLLRTPVPLTRGSPCSRKM